MFQTGEFGIPEEAFERVRDPEMLKRYMNGGKTFQEILGYSEGAMVGFYASAKNLFEQQRYDEAIDAFTFLSTLNPHVPAYWMGLGMSEQLLGLHEKALIAYKMLAVLQPGNPVLHYHTASCHHALKDKQKTIAALETAIETADEDPMQSQLAIQCRKMLSRL